MTVTRSLADLEAAYLDAREARDRLDVARARGVPGSEDALLALEAASTAAKGVVLDALAAMADGGAGLAEADRRALEAILQGVALALADETTLPVAPAVDPAICADPRAWAEAIEAGGEVLRRRLDGCYAATADAIPFGGERLSRPRVLARLAVEAEPGRRRALFLALEPLWRVVDGGGASPYRARLRESVAAWAAGGSPIAANARALGVTAAGIEGWATATLEAWRDAVVVPAHRSGGAPLEPWDWWWAAGAADRALRASLSLARIHDLNRAVHASLGADLDVLGVVLDTRPRPSRPPVPVAFTTFGARPRRRPDGSWSPGAPTVIASYTDGGLGELTELVHETGHAIHLAGIRTRPAFTDWPDSDALTEALAELVTLDVAEPAWRRRWLPDAPEVPEAVSLRGRYADVVLDAAWALFEIRLHADPERPPSVTWTDITSAYLGIAPHSEWSWWAIRGQLVQEPGYMANYAIGAVLAADLRTAIRAARGDWTGGDPGWYPWVRERVYRYGLERPSGELLAGVLGRAPCADALVAEVGRARG